ncbi:Quaternary ammonium compound-resistance protein SugE [Pseudovibrio sp. W64]|uniref:DMT family transporter n=1 Tax=unclassified Pseudovibrio TaxID=2627060 RepID=UPI00070D5AC4|nr:MULTISPECIES: multidrug efflux SMR transporter [unclassified Pseudovibrio]KZK75433.1 Quaternary ammonium compound-resistance protein SugE [Pseudovibrio sp. W64]KZK85966.1 Quaternary ammonium compound-resistance protein SugE [Pseudovibrio sp. Ad13]KZK93795.1 Quaternary ammonium compound-resistance protein SugE [Pseudovibrio sp. Ad46]KZL00009.1 Quaternary ammonium compound-resistance protein SugE [Pseudovibrio sp. Ad5]KZL01128.1 Quaternary ammonium compound-resistance protein SugE [Pseudovibr
MAWIWLIIAGLFEMTFAVCLKLSDGFTRPLYTIAFIITALLSLYFLTKAMVSIPLGTAYAVWTGIGASGIAILGIFLFGEPVTFLRLFFIAMLIAAIVGLKFVSNG